MSQERPYHLSQVLFRLRKANKAETDLVMVAEDYSLTDLIADLQGIATGFQRELTRADADHIRTTYLEELKEDPAALSAFYARLGSHLTPKEQDEPAD